MEKTNRNLSTSNVLMRSGKFQPRDVPATGPDKNAAVTLGATSDGCYRRSLIYSTHAKSNTMCENLCRQRKLESIVHEFSLCVQAAEIRNKSPSRIKRDRKCASVLHVPPNLPIRSYTMFPKLSTALLILTAAASVSAHGALVAVTGSNGVNGQGFGVVDSTPRDGTRRNPFQTDTSIIRDKEIASGDAGPCGRTLAGGVNDMGAQMEAAASAGLPSAAEDGTVTMTIHQVNGDGAGCIWQELRSDEGGDERAWRELAVERKAQDFALVAQMPAGTTCTGGPNGDACVVRCRNAARAGPFGGCTAVTNAQPAANAKVPRGDGCGAEEALAEDLERRSVAVNKKRYVKSRVAGGKAGEWI
ncbi:hypothetical protein RHS01_06284 [Rhizoctonia solani]|uniref:Uncharacterized protein n=1 Tax=Rhizoctonia solani TaxID=456999 RepID=A0A8H7I9D2_9AGAM|nr:hypothetical protein RHS01_06284 [Rhizoctonia solani]